jgi:hypothetical protein
MRRGRCFVREPAALNTKDRKNQASKSEVGEGIFNRAKRRTCLNPCLETSRASPVVGYIGGEGHLEAPLGTAIEETIATMTRLMD